MQLEGVGTSKSAAADLNCFLHWVSGFCCFAFQYLQLIYHRVFLVIVSQDI